MIAADTIASVHETSARSDAAYALPVDIPFIVSEAGESARKWRPAPGELVSLWDMLRVHSAAFVVLLRQLNEVEIALTGFIKEEAQRNEEIADLRARNAIEQDKLLALAKNSEKSWAASSRFMRLSLKHMSDICGEPQLNLSLKEIKWIRENLSSKTQIRELGSELKQLARRIEQELQSRDFFFVFPDRAKYLDEEKPPFGERVNRKFPKLIEDISEASKCIGFDRFTAAVFHLMRVMETAVHRLAKHLHVTVNLNQSWGQILTPIDAAIATLPGGIGASAEQKAWKAACSEAAIFLRHVKDAWRNDTMHPKRTYTPDEADRIFETVKAFMLSLAKMRRR